MLSNRSMPVLKDAGSFEQLAAYQPDEKCCLQARAGTKGSGAGGSHRSGSRRRSRRRRAPAPAWAGIGRSLQPKAHQSTEFTSSLPA